MNPSWPIFHGSWMFFLVRVVDITLMPRVGCVYPNLIVKRPTPLISNTVSLAPLLTRSHVRTHDVIFKHPIYGVEKNNQEVKFDKASPLTYFYCTLRLPLLSILTDR